jgi:hypothetical protein
VSSALLRDRGELRKCFSVWSAGLNLDADKLSVMDFAGMPSDRKKMRGTVMQAALTRRQKAAGWPVARSVCKAKCIGLQTVGTQQQLPI